VRLMVLWLLFSCQDVDEDDADDAPVTSAPAKPLTREEIWAKVSKRYSAAASRR
jgi:hypothetical protein